MEKPPLILVTNDDGIDSPGLRAAAEAAQPFGEVLIVAPHQQQTAMSRAFPRSVETGIIEARELLVHGHPHQAFSVRGSPALVVSHAILEIAERKPDVCISGINYGENLVLGIMPRRTVGAAFEAHSYGIPALAVSLEASVFMQHAEAYHELNWQAAMHFTRHFVRIVLEKGLPEAIAVLNVNVPADATEQTPIRQTVMSRRNYVVFRRPEPRNFAASYRLTVEVEDIHLHKPEADSDIWALILDRVVSVTRSVGI